MTEFDYDVKSRKALVPSARRKRNGVKSKKCTLPSDYMTKKEKLAMNGELTSINTNRVYTYGEFMRFPESLQAEYVRSLKERFDVTPNMLAKLMGCSGSTTSRLMKNLGYDLSGHNSRSTPVQRLEFANFIKAGRNDQIEQAVEQVAAQPVEVIPTQEFTELKASTTAFAAPMSATLGYEGRVRDVCEALVYALGADSVGRFSIIYTRADVAEQNRKKEVEEDA